MTVIYLSARRFGKQAALAQRLGITLDELARRQREQREAIARDNERDKEYRRQMRALDAMIQQWEQA